MTDSNLTVSRRPRLRVATTAIAAVAGATLLFPAVANAAPVSPSAPVPGTHCTVAQVERATAKVAPEFWKRISSNQKAKERFEHRITQTPQQRAAAKQKRQAKLAEWEKAHPGQPMPHRKGPGGKARKQQVEQQIARVKTICTTS